MLSTHLLDTTRSLHTHTGISIQVRHVYITSLHIHVRWLSLPHCCPGSQRHAAGDTASWPLHPSETAPYYTLVPLRLLHPTSAYSCPSPPPALPRSLEQIFGVLTLHHGIVEGGGPGLQEPDTSRWAAIQARLGKSLGRRQRPASTSNKMAGTNHPQPPSRVRCSAACTLMCPLPSRAWPLSSSRRRQ